MPGAVFDWYENNALIDYPFTERQTDGLHTLFVDAYVVHNKLRTYPYSLRIARFKHTTPHLVELRFTDVASTLLATLQEGDPNVEFTIATMGIYTIYEWKRSTTLVSGFTDEDLVVKLAVVTSTLSLFPSDYSPLNAALLSSLVNPHPKRVRRVFVKRAVTGEFDFVTHDDIRFESGNNIELSLSTAIGPQTAGIRTDTATRQPTTVLIDAVAGLGLGPEQRCESTDELKTVNEVGPDAQGNLTLGGDGCTWVERPVVSVGPPNPNHPNTDATLQVGNAHWPSEAPTQTGPGLILHQSCTVCCGCDDYVNAYEAMRSIWVRAQAVAARIALLQAQYNALCALVKSGDGKIPVGIGIKLFMIARPDFFIGAGAIVFNNSSASTGPLTIELELDQVPTDLVYITRSGFMDVGSTKNLQLDPLISVAGLGSRYVWVTLNLAPGQFARVQLETRATSDIPNRATAVISGLARAVWSTGFAEDTNRMQMTPPLSKD